MLDIKILLERDDFCDLNDAAILALAHLGSIMHSKKGACISAESMADESIYLFEGEIELQNENGANQSVTVDSERAKVPLFRFNAAGLQVKCLTSVTFLKFPRYMIRKLSVHDNNIVGINVEEYDDGKNRTLIDEIREQFNGHNVTLSTLPEIASYVNSAIDDPNMSFDKLNGIIQTAPTISARIVSVANNEMFGNPVKIESIAQAITRIGIESVKALVKSVSIRNVFEPKSELVKNAMINFYEHSARIGMICYVLAQHRPDMNSDHAFLAGILHDIGVISVLVAADNHPELLLNVELLNQTVAEHKQEASIMLLRQWEFPDEYVDIARDVCNWDRNIVTADYCDLVQVALMHSHLVGGTKVEGPPLNTLAAFHRLGMDKLNPADNMKLLNELSQRIKDMMKLVCQ